MKMPGPVLFDVNVGDLGLPGKSGSVGEFLTLIDNFRVNNCMATFATLGTVLSAYMLWLMSDQKRA